MSLDERKPDCPKYPNKRCCLLEPEEQIKYNCPYLEESRQ